MADNFYKFIEEILERNSECNHIAAYIMLHPGTVEFIPKTTTARREPWHPIQALLSERIDVFMGLQVIVSEDVCPGRFIMLDRERRVIFKPSKQG